METENKQDKEVKYLECEMVINAMKENKAGGVGSFRMAAILKRDNNKSWQECGEIGTLRHCWQDYKMVEPI